MGKTQKSSAFPPNPGPTQILRAVCPPYQADCDNIIPSSTVYKTHLHASLYPFIHSLWDSCEWHHLTEGGKWGPERPHFFLKLPWHSQGLQPGHQAIRLNWGSCFSEIYEDTLESTVRGGVFTQSVIVVLIMLETDPLHKSYELMVSLFCFWQ